VWICKFFARILGMLHVVVTVMYSGSIHDGILLHYKSQYTTVKHSQKLFEHMYTSDLYGLGTLTPIEFFKHDLLWQSLPFSQSESFQIHVGAIHRRAISPLAHHNGTSACSPLLTCTSPDDRMSSSSTVLTRVLLSRNFLIRTQVFQPKGVRSQIHTSAPDRSLDPTAISVEVPNPTNPYP
jgi:hypothetical protein